MSRRRLAVVGAATAAFFVGGFALAGILSPTDTVATQTFTFTNEGVVTYTIPTVTETVTTTVTVQPPPPPAPPPPPPPPPPPQCSSVVSPGQSIQAALDATVAGNTVCVHAGTYIGKLSPSRSGTSSAPITLEGYPGDAKPVIQPATGLAGNNDTVKITASWFNLRGFIIQGAYTDAGGCQAYNIWLTQGGAAHDDEITDNESRNSTGGSGMLVENSTARIKILRNSFHDNTDTVNCSGAQAHGIYLQGTNHVVANNLIYHLTDPDGGFGIQAYPSGSGSVVAQNTIVGPSIACFYVTVPIQIANNICLNNGGYVSGGGASGCVLTKNLHWNSGTGHTGCTETGVTNADPLLDAVYHLNAGSPAIGVADPAFSYTPDGDGKARDAAPDVGAYER